MTMTTTTAVTTAGKWAMDELLGVASYVFLVVTMVFPCHGRTMVTLALLAGASVGAAGNPRGDRARALASFIFVAVDFVLLPVNSGWWVNNVLSITASVQFMLVFPRMLVAWKNTDHAKAASGGGGWPWRELVVDVGRWAVFIAVLACACAMDITGTVNAVANPSAFVLLGAAAVGRTVGDQSTLLMLLAFVALVIGAVEMMDARPAAPSSHAAVAAAVFAGVGFVLSWLDMPDAHVLMQEAFAFGFVVVVGVMALGVVTVAWTSCGSGSPPPPVANDDVAAQTFRGMGVALVGMLWGVVWVLMYTGASSSSSSSSSSSPKWATRATLVGLASVVVVSVLVGVLVGWVSSLGCVSPGLLALVLVAVTLLPLALVGAGMWLADVVEHLRVT